MLSENDYYLFPARKMLLESNQLSKEELKICKVKIDKDTVKFVPIDPTYCSKVLNRKDFENMLKENKFMIIGETKC